MTKKKQYLESGNTSVIDYPPTHIVPSKNRINQVLHLMDKEDIFEYKSIFMERNWNINLK
jgi:hypothetical protein